MHPKGRWAQCAPGYNWMQAEDRTRSLPAVDNLSHRPAFGVSTTPDKSGSATDEGIYDDAYVDNLSYRPEAADAKEEGLYDDAEEAEDGQFDDALDGEDLAIHASAAALLSLDAKPATVPPQEVSFKAMQPAPGLCVNPPALVATKRKTGVSSSPCKKRALPLTQKSEARIMDASAANALLGIQNGSAARAQTNGSLLPYTMKEALERDTLLDDHRVTCNDVLLTRGARAKSHAGNIFLQRLVDLKRKEYHKETGEKKRTETEAFIVEIARNLKPPAKFLVQAFGSRWKEVGDHRATQIVRQALQAKSSVPLSKFFSSTEMDATTEDANARDGDVAQAKEQNNPLASNKNHQRFLDLQAVAASEGAAVMANFPMGVPAVFPTINPFALGAVIVPPYSLPDGLQLAQMDAARAAYFGGALAATNMQAQLLMARRQSDTVQAQNIFKQPEPEGEGPSLKPERARVTGIQPLLQALARESSDNRAVDEGPENITSS